MATEIEMTNCIEESEPLNENGRLNIKTSKGPRQKRSKYGESETELIQYIKNASYDSFKRRSSQEMDDAPFEDSRAGSEEDILEYDDDEPIFNCDACRRRRRLTVIEKTSIGFGFVCLIIIIILAIHLGKKKEIKPPIRCESTGCLNAASSLMGAMDPSANPCEDFHQYACGGWLKETPIPPGYPMWDRFQQLSYKNMYMLKDFLESHSLHGAAQQKAKMYYQSCMGESKVPRETTLNNFKSLLQNISKTNHVFNLMEILSDVHRLNTWPLFQVIVGPDERNPKTNIIKIEAGSSPFPYNSFKSEEKKLLDEINSSNATSTPVIDSAAGNIASGESNTNVTVNGNSEGTNETTNNATEESTTQKPTTTPTTTTTKKPHIKDTHPHPVVDLSDMVGNYLRETSVLLQTLWGMEKENAEIESKNILELEKKLSLAHDIDLHVHNRTQAYNAMTIKNLQRKCRLFSWTTYLNGIFDSHDHQLDEKTEVIVLHERALEEVCVIVEDYMRNASSISILKRYILISLARSMMRYFDMNTFDPELDPDDEVDIEGEHWRRCTFYTNKALGLATGSIYVNATSSDTSMNQITDLVNYVKKGFKDYLLRKIWLDEKTKRNAAEKIDEMIEKVSYPSFMLNITFLDEFYGHFSIGQDWFRNLLNWRTFSMGLMRKSLNQQFDRKNSWLNPPVTVESDYSPVRNDIIFPIALFHLPIYSNEGPSALNFGAIGSLIGHEITHAFDIQGRQYDGFGRLRDWWDPVTAGMFNETTQCMKDQYDHYKIDNMTINGEQTLEENIADNGGLRAAQIAFELWIKEHGEEEPLPGVTLTNRQIFYISFAQLYCSKWKDYGIKDFLVRDSHSPGPYRIEGALSNSFAFQDVFKCSYISRYNPSIKCRVW